MSTTDKIEAALITVEQVEDAIQEISTFFGLNSTEVLHVAATKVPALAPVPPEKLSDYLAQRAKVLGAKTAAEVASPAAIVTDVTVPPKPAA